MGNSDSENDMMNDRLTIGGDYYLSKRSTLSFETMGSWNANDNEFNSVTGIGSASDNVVDSVLLAPNRFESEVENYNANLNYTYEDTSGRRLDVNIDFLDFRSDRDAFQPNIYVGPDNEEVLSENINFQNTPTQINALTGKIDYEQSLGGGRLTIGSKVSQVNTDNTFDFFNVENGERIFVPEQSNTFTYEEVIAAGYINYAFSVKKFKFQAGVRAENTYSVGDLKAQQEVDDKVVERNYLDWFSFCRDHFYPK